MTTQAQDVQTQDVEVLTPETISPETQSTAAEPALDSRCQHRYQNGKRCRLPGSEPQLGLCPRHFRQRLAAGLPPTDDSSDLSPELLGGIKFSSADDLREFLTRLPNTNGQRPRLARRAAVLAYVTNQLLRSHVVAEKELAEEPQPYVFDLPSPQRDDVVSPERDFVNRMAELGARCKTPVPPDSYDGWTADMDKSK